MKKLNCIVCDNPACRKVIPSGFIQIQGKKRDLHYCSIKCVIDHYLYPINKKPK